MIFQVITQKDIAVVHEKSLEILERAGINVDSPKILDMMEQAGCVVDRGKNNIRFPRGLVEECLKLAPGQFALGSLDGKNAPPSRRNPTK